MDTCLTCLCPQFHHWGCLDLPKLMEAFFLLFTYYVNECSSGKAGQGAFAIHPDLKPLFCELLPENLPYNSCPPPQEIVDYLKMSEEREKSVNLMAIREKCDLYSPTYPYPSSRAGPVPAHTFHHHSSSFNYSSGVNSGHLGVNTGHLSSLLPNHTTFSFDRSLDEFGLSNLTR